MIASLGLASRKLRTRAKESVDRVLGKKRRLMEFGIRPYFLPPKIRHIYGPERISYGLEELLVISVVRNGELYIRSFLEHYRSMDVRHFVFLDNESTDRTVEMLCEHDDVTVLQTSAPYQKYENTMKRYLAERFSSGRWNLCADIDELFDYPYSDSLSLAGLLRYLNTNRYTAVVAQMLDMFANMPLTEVKSRTEDVLSEKYPYYDISSIDKEEYLWSQRSNREIKMHWGGIRKQVFGTINGLTKSPLVFMDGKVRPFVTWHHVQGARMADISCVLRHYPFVSSFSDKVEDAVRTGRYGFKVDDEYKAYAKTLRHNKALTLEMGSAQRFVGLEPLIDARFLIVSANYQRWVGDNWDDQPEVSSNLTKCITN